VVGVVARTGAAALPLRTGRSAVPLITVPVEGAGSRHASLEAKIAELEDSGAVNIHVSRDEDKFLVTYDVKRGPGRPKTETR
jgi:hypothetical protein